MLDEHTLKADDLKGLSKSAISDLAASLPAQDNKRRPRREKLPEHLRRVEHHHEPENTTCPTPECGQAMVRIGEDVSERLDIVPAEFFGLAGRVDPEGQPFVRQGPSSGRSMSALSTATSAASGCASAANKRVKGGLCRNPWSRRSSTRARPRRA